MISETQAGGQCSKNIEASDGVIQDDYERVNRIGDSCYKDKNQKINGYCG